MRYSEGNLNRLQIAGELHVKSGKVLDARTRPGARRAARRRAADHGGELGEPRADVAAPARATSSRRCCSTSTTRATCRPPHPRVVPSLLQDQILGDGEETVKKHAGAKALAELQARARRTTWRLGRAHPKRLDRAGDAVLGGLAGAAAGERAAIAREVVGGFVERVEQAASVDPRPEQGDPMEWHRHRVHPSLWRALDEGGKGGKAGDRALAELAAWRAKEKVYRARRPICDVKHDTALAEVRVPGPSGVTATSDPRPRRSSRCRRAADPDGGIDWYHRCAPSRCAIGATHEPRRPNRGRRPAPQLEPTLRRPGRSSREAMKGHPDRGHGAGDASGQWREWRVVAHHLP